MSLFKLQWDMKDMMDGFGQLSRQRPDSPPVSAKELQLRKNLIKEETDELLEALDEGHLPSIAKEIIDVLVVTIGTSNCLGLGLTQLWKMVHRSNMAKMGGPVREDGKHLKPEGWQPPDVEGELRSQGWCR
jgi:predicted HAD superfamily Cof-like phosphohydrolase